VELEGLKAVPPLRAGRWRLARDGGRGEVALQIAAAFGVGVGAVLLDQEAAAAKVLLPAPNRALEHLAHLARLQMAERLPGEIGALLVLGAIESDQVEVWVEAEIGRSPLDDGDGARLCSAFTIPRRALDVERVHRLLEDAREAAEKGSVLGEAAPPREWKRQHPLAKAGLWQHALDEVGGRRAHPPSHTGRAKTPSLATERHDQALTALRTPKPAPSSILLR
jgi:hypothetical protein